MRFRGALLLTIASSAVGAVACAPPTRPSETAGTTLRADPSRKVRITPVSQGARVVPIDVPENRSLGVEPGGGTRSIAGGVRVVSLLGGAIAASEDRLPGARWEVITLPERLGGGFLIKVEDRTIWRAEKWLGPAHAIYAANGAIARIVPGLDRVYVLAGGWHAFDGATGEEKPLGPWPASPTVGAYAAADGWRALAIADLRGAVTTSDAGATWRALSLPVEPREIFVKGDSLEVKGPEPGRGDAFYEVRPDGQVTRVSETPAAQSAPAPVTAGDTARPLGTHALVAAVDDGWPLDDGTALVARDGALWRVSLEDGAIVESAPAAFPLRPSRCHPVPLGAAGAIGFVCGEPRGATVLYSFDAAQGRMIVARSFDDPRAVLPSGNGAIAVRGPCDPHARGDVDPEAHHYCLRTRDGAWREIRVEGVGGGERVAVLADGRFVIVSPPQRGREKGSVTIVLGEGAQSVPLVLSDVAADVARVLGVGVWLDGIEERRPGVLGGWVEAAGTMLGFELTLDGKVSFGELVRGDSSLPMVSGRYGLGWSVAHGGVETTNGGMTWAPITVPEPIKPLREVTSRACGPVGCSAAGWLRIGWGSGVSAQAPAVHAAHPTLPRPSSSLSLDCDAGEVAPRAGTSAVDPLSVPPQPVTSKDVRLAVYETSDTLERTPRTTTLARLFAWGPRSEDWDRTAKWVVRWTWPFGGATDTRSSAAAAAPATVIDAAKLGAPSMEPALVLALAPGDDASHALLVARRSRRAEQAIFELEADRAPLEIKRGDGEPLGEVEAAVRTSGRWYLATASPPPRQPARTESIVWQIEGGVARELARIPRTPSPDGRISSGRLAARSDGRALGFVVAGQPMAERSDPSRWVAPIDLDTGTVGDVELLGPFFLGAERSVSLCTPDDVGWSTDVPLEGDGSFPIGISSRGSPLGALSGAIARVRLAPSRACVERVAGSLGNAIEASGQHTPSSTVPASITVVATTGSGGNDGKARRVFRCGVR